jgi:small GTP-binding protein
MLRRILTPQQDDLVRDIRQTVTELSAALVRFDAAPEDLSTLERSSAQLDHLFLLVVAGEFNAGKSAFINALLGSKVLEEGVTPTTTRVHVLEYGETVERKSTEAAVDVITAPVPLLAEIRIVDTPGTNAIHRDHEAITNEFVPRSDMVLFVTSADRPFTESERAFLETIRGWGKKIAVVVNKVDILETEEDRRRVADFVGENARALLGVAPEVFLVSARLAQRAKATSDAALLAESRFAPLESAIVDRLDEKERVRLKLGNPLGVAGKLAGGYLEVVLGRLTLLKDDVAALEDIDRQLAAYKEDLRRDFRFRLADVDNVLHDFESRGMSFFDETVRLARVIDLLNKERTKGEFERKVVADLPQVIERRVTEVIDWMVASDLKQWQAVMDHVGQRRLEHADRIVGKVGGGFDLDRARLLDSVGKTAQKTVESYDRDAESTRMALSIQGAVTSTALVEVGAIGLGAAIAHVAASAAIDFTGILAASVVALLGFFILPNRREAAKRDLRDKIAALRDKLMGSLTAQFDREVERGVQRIEEAIAPYTRFVRAERERLAETRAALEAVRDRLVELRRRVESL